MTTRVPINRPLTEPERTLLNFLAIKTISTQYPCGDRAAADALDEFADRGLVYLRGDAYDVFLSVDGRDLVHCAWCSGPTSGIPATG